MFQIGKTIVSEEILTNYFVCHLDACQGACCVRGEYGAPLEDVETELLAHSVEAVTPYLRPEGVEAIAEQGPFVEREHGVWETPLVDQGECAYVVFSEEGIAKCGLEVAHKAGAISWKKPISCHLYPIRTREHSEFTAVHYHKWNICNPACRLGQELKVPIYQFVKEALIRKFGKAWYEALEEVALEKAKQ